jgi:outer membrane protein
MRRMTLASAVIVTVLVSRGFAQTTPPPPPPPPAGQQATPPATQTRPATPAPLPTPPKPTVPFPEGAKIAFVSLNAIVIESKLGKQGQEEMKKFVDRESAPLTAKQKSITDLEKEIQTQGTLLMADAISRKQRDLETMKRQFQYDQNEFQAKVAEFNQQLVKNLEAKVLPIIDAIRTEKGLWVIFADQGSDQNGAAGLSVVSFHPGLDLTAEIVKRLDAATPAAAGR